MHFVYILDAESYCILQRVQSASALCQLHLDISHGQAWGQDEMSFFQGMHEQSWTGAYKLLCYNTTSTINRHLFTWQAWTAALCLQLSLNWNEMHFDEILGQAWVNNLSDQNNLQGS